MDPTETKTRRGTACFVTRRRMLCVLLVLIPLVVTAWHFRQGNGGPVSVAPRVLLAHIEAGSAPLVLDVRSPEEFASGHVPGALNMPVWNIPWQAADLGEPKARPLVVYCEHGPRAVLAREILNFMGYTNVGLLEGHMSGWRQQNLTTR
jgi:rhodanese-related sulfurtransferase